MGRYYGKSTTVSTFNVKAYAPLDVRMIVEFVSDLTLDATWTIDGGLRTYNGMLTVVANDTAENCGVYYLQDADKPGKNDEPDHTNINNWHKLCDASEISTLIDSLTEIQDELESINEQLAVVESKTVDTYGYRSGFPSTGVEGKLYVAIDEQQTYIWTAGEYLVVGGSDALDITMINGGTAESEN